MSDRENTENKLLTPTLILPPQGGGKRKIDSLVRRNDRGNNGNDIRGIGDDPGEVRPHEAIKMIILFNLLTIKVSRRGLAIIFYHLAPFFPTNLY